MNTPDVFVKMALDSWNSNLNKLDKLFAELSDEDLQKEVAPGRNRGVYLLGHMAATHDRMLPLLGLGERLFPLLDKPFLENPDRAMTDIPPVSELRRYWREANAALTQKMAKLTAAQWFEKHTAVAAADFEREPHRNRLNVVLSRTVHIMSHYGQLIFLKAR